MQRPPVPWLVVLLAFAPAAVGCEEEEAPDSAEPIVGAMELPVSRRSGDALPEAALQIEVSPTELRLDDRKVLDLESGRAPESERRGVLLPKLQAAIRGGGAKGAAGLRVHANTPYETLVALVHTAREAGVGTVGFAVRGGGAETGWLVPADARVQAPGEDPVEHAGEAQRAWDELAKVWSEVHQACMKRHAVDCDPAPEEAAEGGKVQITMLARGQGLKLHFLRFGADEEDDDEDAKAKPARHAALIPGVPPPPGAGEAEEEEEGVPPATEAAFTWKLAAATEEESPISLAMRPLCGARPCGAVVTSEYMTPGMRTVSFLGAAFPDGAPAPSLVFLEPRH
ncbi:MAG: hypothetical protein ACODAU_12835 [Myxococcota bacterium]